MIEVVDAGLLTTVQDRGRAGWAHIGVPRSGAVDPALAAVVNRLVGNDGGAPSLETVGGLAIRAVTPVTIASDVEPVARTLGAGEYVMGHIDLRHTLRRRALGPGRGFRSQPTNGAQLSIEG